MQECVKVQQIFIFTQNTVEKQNIWQVSFYLVLQQSGYSQASAHQDQ